MEKLMEDKRTLIELTVQESFVLAKELLLKKVTDKKIYSLVLKFYEGKLMELNPYMDTRLFEFDFENESINGVPEFRNFVCIKFYQRLANYSLEINSLNEGKFNLLIESIDRVMRELNKYNINDILYEVKDSKNLSLAKITKKYL